MRKNTTPTTTPNYCSDVTIPDYDKYNFYKRSYTSSGYLARPLGVSSSASCYSLHYVGNYNNEQQQPIITTCNDNHNEQQPHPPTCFVGGERSSDPKNGDSRHEDDDIHFQGENMILQTTEDTEFYTAVDQTENDEYNGNKMFSNNRDHDKNESSLNKKETTTITKEGSQSPDSAVHNSDEDRQGSSSSQSVSSSGGDDGVVEEERRDYSKNIYTTCDDDNGPKALLLADDGNHSDYVDDFLDDEDDEDYHQQQRQYGDGVEDYQHYTDGDVDPHRCMWRGRENDAPPTLSVSVRQLVGK